MKVAIIGGGTIGSSISIPLKRAGYEVVITRRNTSKLEELKRSGIEISTDNVSAAKEAEIVIFALKPSDMIPQVMAMKSTLQGKILISMAAAVPMRSIQSAAEDSYIARAMTNIAARVGAGFTPYCVIRNDPDKVDMIESVLRSFGDVERVEEKYMDSLTALSGSGPA